MAFFVASRSTRGILLSALCACQWQQPRPSVRSVRAHTRRWRTHNQNPNNQNNHHRNVLTHGRCVLAVGRWCWCVLCCCVCGARRRAIFRLYSMVLVHSKICSIHSATVGCWQLAAAAVPPNKTCICLGTWTLYTATKTHYRVFGFSLSLSAGWLAVAILCGIFSAFISVVICVRLKCVDANSDMMG